MILLSTPLLAAEADYFTRREDAPEVSAMLDKKMNEELNAAAGKVKNCSVEALRTELIKSMGGFGIAQIESWLDDNKEAKATGIKFKKSIYQGTMAEAPMAALACCAPLATYKGRVFSADKLGHFLHTGFEMYVVANDRPFLDEKRAPEAPPTDFSFSANKALIEQDAKTWKLKTRGQGATAVLEASQYQENNLWGKMGTGVYSYADIAANYEGYRFWSDLTSGDNPYFVCEHSRWKQARKFSWDEYISDAWDESINCNEYVSSKMKMTVMAASGEVLRKKGWPAKSCPIEPQKCRALVKRYPGALKDVIGPRCQELGLQEPTAAGSNDEGSKSAGGAR
ncbi:hypothetical protein AZI86_00060 [Bdellovibrio bacteriovorus]|uniref:Uncharacterized protein n=2 Tax=Bdellovibrio bacteriovorus TaxID=959 RepID=A0A150WM74_BDEBC|nr:hypothetical protein AZI86_00060 [Bdellovibrio bacteriovorus]